MSKNIKILASLFFVFVVVVIAAVFLISSKINPEVIRKGAIEVIEKNIPGAKADISLVDYTIGPSVTIEIKSFSLKVKKSMEPLLNLKEFKVKVPILAILTGGGTIDVLTDSPEVFIKQQGDDLNWSLLNNASSAKNSKEIKNKGSKSDKSMSLPSFITNSKVNFKLKDLFVSMNQDGKKSSFKVGKIVAKDFSLGKTTAYEVSSAINYEIEKGKFFSTRIQIIGELDLKKFLKEGEISTSAAINILKSSLSGLPVEIPDIKGSLKAKLGKDIWASMSWDADRFLTLKSEIFLKDSKLLVKGLDLSIEPEIGIKFLKEKAEILSSINFNKSRVSVNGNVKLNLDSKRLVPDLKIKTSKKIDFTLKEGMVTSSELSGIIKGNSIDLRLMTDLFKGVITTKIKTSLDVMSIPSDLSKMNPINLYLGISNVKVSKSFIQKTLYGGEKKKEVSGESVATASKAMKTPLPLLPKININVDGKHIFIASEESSIQGKINVFKRNVSSSGVKLIYGNGSVTTQFLTRIKYLEDIMNDIDVKLSSIEVSSFNAFFPPFLKDVKGRFDGSVKGSIHLADIMKYNLGVNIKGSKGDLKGLNVNKFIDPLLGSLKQAKGKIPKVDSKFDLLFVKVKASETLASFDKFDFRGHDESFKTNLLGNISMIDKKSELTGDIYSKSISAELEKTTGQNLIPIKLKGRGFLLLPETGYTTGKLLKFATNKEMAKEKKKIQKSVDKEKKKLEDELKKKAKSLLKGFKL